METKEEVYPQMLSLFENNPSLTIEEIIKIVNDAYKEAQLNSIKPYEPIKVDPLDDDNSSYHANVEKHETSGFQDADLHSPTFVDSNSEIL